jgi:hypothetical protein
MAWTGATFHLAFYIPTELEQEKEKYQTEGY